MNLQVMDRLVLGKQIGLSIMRAILPAASLPQSVHRQRAQVPPALVQQVAAEHRGSTGAGISAVEYRDGFRRSAQFRWR